MFHLMVKNWKIHSNWWFCGKKSLQIQILKIFLTYIYQSLLNFNNFILILVLSRVKWTFKILKSQIGRYFYLNLNNTVREKEKNYIYIILLYKFFFFKLLMRYFNN